MNIDKNSAEWKEAVALSYHMGIARGMDTALYRLRCAEKQIEFLTGRLERLESQTQTAGVRK